MQFFSAVKISKPPKICFVFVAVFVAAKLNASQGLKIVSTTSERNFIHEAQSFFRPTENSNYTHISFENSSMINFYETPATVTAMCRNKPKFKLDENFLLTFLLQLKLCQHVIGYPWLDEECAKLLYDLTDYHKASYDKICNPAKYASFCQLTEIKQHLQPSTIIRRWLQQRNIVIQDSDDEKQNETFHNRSTTSNLTRLERMTCQSIESYFEVLSEQMLQNDSVNLSQSPWNAFQNVPYTEWYHNDRAFCEESGCGVSKKDYEKFSITFHDCVSESCQLANVVTMVVDSVIALLVVVANLAILTIFFQTPIMKNIPGYFKLNLAIADLSVGLIMILTVIYNRYRQTYLPLPYRYDGEQFGLLNYFDKRYSQSVGFFGLLFLFVSIFTLCAASVDRYLAITKPFNYKQGKYFTRKKTAVILVILWLIGAAWALIPSFDNSRHATFGSDLILPSQPKVVILYIVLLGMPLITAWILNIALLINVRANNRKRANSKSKSSNIKAHTSREQFCTKSGFVTASNCTQNLKIENCLSYCHGKKRFLKQYK